MKKFNPILLTGLMAAAGTAGASAGWTNIGRGVYHEGLLTYYGEEMGVERGMTWLVDIEEDSDVKGLYRLAPYAGNNPVAELMGVPDDTYMVIHAEDPTKVWMEDFDSYDSMLCFTHMVAESGWEAEPAGYGTLTDGVIAFPAMCMATVDITDPEGQWHSANREGEFVIELPEAAVGYDDYSLYLDYRYCGADNKVPVTITAGASIKEIKYLLEPGTVEPDASDETCTTPDWSTIVRAASDGKAITAGEHLMACPAHGVHSLTVVGLDAEGTARIGKLAYIYGDTSDDTEWSSLGTVPYTEDFFAGYYEELEPVTLQAELQAHKSTEGFYRLVNPYAGYEYNFLENHDGHKHYIYIHAENPAGVWIENSPIGVDFADGLGEARVTSTVAMYIEAGCTPEEAIAMAEDEAGTFDGNTIEFPNWGLWVAQTGWFNGYWTSTGKGFCVDLTGVSGLSAVETAPDASAPAEYYNLQGVRIAGPRAGSGLFIRRTGDRVEKLIR